MKCRESAFKRCALWRTGLEAAVSDSSRLSSVLWDELLAEQRQSLLRTLGAMTLRRVRHTPIIEETSDDERRAHAKAERHAA